MKKQLLQMLAMLIVVAVVLALGVGSVLAQAPTVNVTLGMSEFKFDPNELDVAQGTEVTFNVSNTGQFPHNVTFIAPDGTESDLFETNLTAGESRTGVFTFNQVGEWKMYCPVGQHEERGMVGTVRVAAAGGNAAGGATTGGAGQAAASGQATPQQQPATLPSTGGGLLAIAGTALVALGALALGVRMRRE